MRAIVTGGAGFIGSHVVDALLERGDEVHVLDDLSTGKRERVAEGARLHVADIRAADEVFDAVRPDAVLHLAAQADVRASVERPDHDADVNILGTLRVLEAARRHGAKIVFSSTGERSTANATAPRPRRPSAARSRPTERRSSAVRNTSPRGTGFMERATCRCDWATSTARARSPTAKRALSRSSWGC